MQYRVWQSVFTCPSSTSLRKLCNYLINLHTFAFQPVASHTFLHCKHGYTHMGSPGIFIPLLVYLAHCVSQRACTKLEVKLQPSTALPCTKNYICGQILAKMLHVNRDIMLHGAPWDWSWDYSMDKLPLLLAVNARRLFQFIRKIIIIIIIAKVVFLCKTCELGLSVLLRRGFTRWCMENFCL